MFIAVENTWTWNVAISIGHSCVVEFCQTITFSDLNCHEGGHVQKGVVSLADLEAVAGGHGTRRVVHQVIIRQAACRIAAAVG